MTSTTLDETAPPPGGGVIRPDSEALCWVAAAASHPLARWLLPVGAGISLLPWTPPWAALLAGTALALSAGNPCAVLTNRSSKWLLQLAVVGLGAGVNLAVVARVGLDGLGYSLIGLAVTFLVGAWLMTTR